jgi:hypothetical protein
MPPRWSEFDSRDLRNALGTFAPVTIIGARRGRALPG